MDNRDINEKCTFKELQKVARLTYGTLGLALVVSLDYIKYCLGYKVVEKATMIGPIILIAFIVWTCYKLRKAFNLFK